MKRLLGIEYSYTLGFLYTILSAFSYLEAEYELRSNKSLGFKLDERIAVWDAQSEALVEWIFGEQTSIHHFIPDITKGESALIFRSMEQLGDELTYEWCEKLVRASQAASSLYSINAPSLYQYLFYCGVVSQTLDEFDRTLAAKTRELPELEERYRQKQELWVTLKSKLESEVSVVYQDFFSLGSTSNQLQELVDKIATELIEGWHNAIDLAVEDFEQK